MRNKFFEFLFFWIYGIFSAFVPLASFVYLSSLSIFKVRMRFSHWVISLFVFMVFLIKIFESKNLKIFILTFLSYFGFIFIFFFIKYFKVYQYINFKSLFFLFVAITLVDCIAVNFFISAEYLPNYPDVSDNPLQTHIDHFGYQRPYSFGGSSTISSVILLSISTLLIIRREFKVFDLLLLLLCILLFKSGTGFVLTLFFLPLILMIRYRKYGILLFPILVLIFSSIIIYIFTAQDLALRFSGQYLLYILEFKFLQVSELFGEYGLLDYFFGRIGSLDAQAGGYGYKGDFGWLEVVLGYGWFGLSIILSFIFVSFNRINFVPIIILLFGTFHYGVIHNVVGQIVLACFMCIHSGLMYQDK